MNFSDSSVSGGSECHWFGCGFCFLREVVGLGCKGIGDVGGGCDN